VTSVWSWCRSGSKCAVRGWLKIAENRNVLPARRRVILGDRTGIGPLMARPSDIDLGREDRAAASAVTVTVATRVSRNRGSDGSAGLPA